MEFLHRNLLNTTTMVNVASGTGTARYLFDRNTKLGWTSSGYNTNTACVISVEFATPQVISHVLLQNHNFKAFRMFYNSATANTFTPDCNVAGNSATNSYVEFASITVSSVQIQIDTTIAGTEKSIGELVVSYRDLAFDMNPNVENYNPALYRKQIRHEMPDGGIVLFNIRDKFRVSMSWECITEAFKNNLFSIYDTAMPYYFVPNATATSWDGNAYECVWSGDFDFKYFDNVKTTGYAGSLTLEQTTSG